MEQKSPDDSALRAELAALRRDLDSMRAGQRNDSQSFRDASGREPVTTALSSRAKWASNLALHEEEATLLSPKTAKRLEKATEECELAESVWDAAVFAFTDVAGSLGSVFFAILLLANVIMQFSFIFIIWYGLLDPNISDKDVDNIKDWRRQLAHSIKYYDELSGESLARRVCNQDFGLEVAGFQSSLYQAFVAYLGPLSGRAGIGPYLCMLAMTAWAMVLAKEANEALAVMCALLAVPRGATSIHINSRGQVTLEKLSKARVAVAVGLHGLRLVIAALLAWVGCVYLGRTIDPGDLILNAVALEFILNVDDLIFTCFAPKRFRALVKHAKTLESPSFLPSRRGLNLGAVCTLFVVMSGLMGLYFGLLVPQTRLLQDGMDAMCAGDLDFVFSTDSMGGAHWARTRKGNRRASRLEKRNFPDGKSRSKVARMNPLTPYDDDATSRLTYVERLVDTVCRQYAKDHFQNSCNAAVCNNYTLLGADYPTPKHDLPACCLPLKTRLADPSLVISAATSPLEDVVEHMNPASFDVIDIPLAGTTMFKQSVSSLVSTKACGGCSIWKPFCVIENRTCVDPTCETLKPYCNDVTSIGRRTRGLCSIECQCVVQRSSLALSHPDQGCGHVVSSGIARDNLDAIPCEDVAMDDPTWLAFLDNANLAAEAQPLDERTWALEGSVFLRRWGCRYLRDESLWDNMTTVDAFVDSASTNATVRSPYFLGRNPCVRGGLFTKPLSFFCPVACGCHRGDQDCPTQCPERTASSPLCPAWHKDVFPSLEWCAQLPDARTFDLGPPGTGNSSAFIEELERLHDVAGAT